MLIGFALRAWLEVANLKEKRKAAKAEPQKIVASKSAAEQSDEEYKMVLCVNEILKMGKGKIAAQCAHAAVGVVDEHREFSNGEFEAWELKGHAKVALRVANDTDMLELARLAEAQGMFTYVVVDAGRTQIPAGSRTVLAIGPAPKRLVDKITGHLKLL